MIERTAYVCEHCNTMRPIKKRAYLSKEKAEIHERHCFYNPKKKACWTCINNDYYTGINHCNLGHGKPAVQQFDMPPSDRLTINCEHWSDFEPCDESEVDE